MFSSADVAVKSHSWSLFPRAVRSGAEGEDESVSYRNTRIQVLSLRANDLRFDAEEVVAKNFGRWPLKRIQYIDRRTAEGDKPGKGHFDQVAPSVAVAFGELIE